jgi:CHAT domain-containing protein
MVDKNGRSQNGFLELQDIYNLNLPVDLVVLSACETGLGKEISGEGLVGLTRGFMYAGASRVVASLWKVSDAGTATLMAGFYTAMEKDHLPPAAALRAAQIQLWKQKRWNSPYYWAAFQIQGEWK